MPRWLTISLSVVGVISQYSTLATTLVPPAHQAQVSAIIVILMGALAALAHDYNPDGTKATLPYVPPAAPEAKQ